LARNGGPQAEFQFSFGSAKEGLVDLRLVGIQGDVGAGAVGVALEDDLIFRTKLEKASELQGR